MSVGHYGPRNYPGVNVRRKSTRYFALFVLLFALGRLRLGFRLGLWCYDGSLLLSQGPVTSLGFLRTCQLLMLTFARPSP